MGILEVLTIVFVVLKLVGVITWSWWTVFIPMYIAVVWYVIILGLQIAILVKSKNEMNVIHKRRRGLDDD